LVKYTYACVPLFRNPGRTALRFDPVPLYLNHRDPVTVPLPPV
jgi:hypothetical protein